MGERLCPTCGRSNPLSAHFCPNCGEQQPTGRLRLHDEALEDFAPIGYDGVAESLRREAVAEIEAQSSVNEVNTENTDAQSLTSPVSLSGTVSVGETTGRWQIACPQCGSDSGAILGYSFCTHCGTDLPTDVLRARRQNIGTLLENPAPAVPQSARVSEMLAEAETVAGPSSASVRRATAQQEKQRSRSSGSGTNTRAGVQAQRVSEAKSEEGVSPFFAALCSFFLPGLGQILNRQTGKGVLLLVAAYCAVVYFGMSASGIALIIARAVIALDAHQVARRRRLGKTVGEWEWRLSEGT